jgi:metal-responsive CopG/Arc/MetJ family transcriptional regulator
MTVQIDIDEKRLNRIDSFSKKFDESRADFLQRAVDEALIRAEKRLEIAEKERKAIEAYRKTPQKPEEYEIWQDEQYWSDE